jgi:hypothetical protein
MSGGYERVMCGYVNKQEKRRVEQRVKTNNECKNEGKQERGTSLISLQGGNILNRSNINGKLLITVICLEWLDMPDTNETATYSGSGTPCLVRAFCSSL